MIISFDCFRCVLLVSHVSPGGTIAGRAASHLLGKIDRRPLAERGKRKPERDFPPKSWSLDKSLPCLARPYSQAYPSPHRCNLGHPRKPCGAFTAMQAIVMGQTKCSAVWVNFFLSYLSFRFFSLSPLNISQHPSANVMLSPLPRTERDQTRPDQTKTQPLQPGESICIGFRVSIFAPSFRRPLSPHGNADTTSPD